MIVNQYRNPNWNWINGMLHYHIPFNLPSAQQNHQRRSVLPLAFFHAVKHIYTSNRWKQKKHVVKKKWPPPWVGLAWKPNICLEGLHTLLLCFLLASIEIYLHAPRLWIILQKVFWDTIASKSTSLWIVRQSEISLMFSGFHIMRDTTNKTLALNFNNAYPLLLLFSNINIEVSVKLFMWPPRYHLSVGVRPI